MSISKRNPAAPTPTRRRARVRVQESEYGRELIVDETFASLYRPGVASTGSVWDAIALPVLLIPPAERTRFLLLGLGGGSVARAVRGVAPGSEFVGIEFDAEVVDVGRREFGLDDLDLEIIVDDAALVLKRERRRFDVVFDDVFIGRGDDVHKPNWIPVPGHEHARARLRPGGILVTNTLDEAPTIARHLESSFASVVQITVDDFDNRIYAASDRPFDAKSLRAVVAAEPLFRETLPSLSFKTIKTSG